MTKEQRLALLEDAKRYYACDKTRKKIWHILKWGIKLIVPDFLIQYPNFSDNWKIFRKHPHFRPFRMALIAWLIFTMTIGSSGVLILLTAPKAAASGEGWLDGWQYRNKITISNTNVDADLSYFPLLVEIAETGGGATNIGADISDTTNGYDIRFTDSDGTTLLSYERESLSVASNNLTATLWVKVPTVDHDAATDIYIYYGNAGASTDWTAENGSGDCSAITQAKCVWKEGSSQNFIGVWHLKESGTGSLGDYKDSTANALNSINTTNQPSAIAGKIGVGENFNGSTYFSVGDNDLLDFSTSATIAFWYKRPAAGVQTAVCKWASSQQSYCLQTSTDNNIYFSVSGTGSNTVYFASDNKYTDTDWHQIAAVYDGVSLVVYLDGALVPGSSHGAIPASLYKGTAPFGNYYNAVIYMNSTLDDLRVSSSVRSAAWIKFEYNNINSVNNEINVFSQEELNVAPNTPTNSSPANAAVHQSLTPILVSSAFSDANIGDAHAASQWQITANSGNYTAPIFDSGTDSSNRTSLTVPASTLTNGATYYWHVRYEDDKSAWSEYSSQTSFTTARLPETPSNVTPNSGAINQDPVLTLMASPFSDLDAGATEGASQWQVRTLGDPTYSAPAYDSGTYIGSVSSFAVPSNNLQKNTTYYWRVRYRDDLGNWSAYSTETVFSTGVTPISVVSVGSAEYQSGEIAKLTVQVQKADGTSVNNGTVVVTVYNPSNTAVVSDASMAYIVGSNGLYYYNYTVPATEGVYTYQVTATYNANTSYSSHAFHVSPAMNTITTLNTNLNTVNSNLNTVNTNLNTVSTNVSSVNSTVNTVNTNLNSVNSTLSTVNANVSSIKTTVENASANLDVLIGALIVTQSTVNDNATSTTAFVTSLTNATDDFYNNSVLTFTSGSLNGQARRISDYSGTSKQITVSPALSSAPVNGSAFTIVKQNTYVEEQLAAHETAQSASRTKVEDIQTKTTDIQTKATDIQTKATDIQTKVTDVQTKVTDIQTKVTDIQTNMNATYALLQSVDTKIDTIDGNVDALTTSLATVDGNVDSILVKWGTATAADLVSDVSDVKDVLDDVRASQQLGSSVHFSGAHQVENTKTYRATVTVLNHENQLTDAVSAPSITVYDALRAEAEKTFMTRSATGVYDYSYVVPSNASAGVWESIVAVDLGGAAPVVTHDYWEVEGAPSQVIINYMSDSTLPSAAANITITNEGTTQYEYQYEYCIVSTESNQCGGGDDTAYASAAKLLRSGESWNTNLGLSLSNIGTYWFKVVVHWGTERSGASRTFDAVAPSSSQAFLNSATPAPSPTSSVVPGAATGVGIEDVYNMVLNLQRDLLSSGKTQIAYNDIKEIKNWLGVSSGELNQPLYKQISDVSLQLNKSMSTLSAKIDPSSSGIRSLLDLSKTNVNNVQDMQNKLADLRAISSSTQRIMEQNVSEPVVQTWMTFNSVEFNFLISNPLTEKKVLKFKSYLPAEVKPENVMNLGGLSLDYDSNANSYFVYGDISLGPKESVTRKVEIKDIWVYSTDEINALKKQAENLISPLSKTQYEAQGSILKNEVESILNTILLNQTEGYRTPQDHIVAHRANEIKMVSVKSDLDKMRDLVVQAGASQGVVGKVGGIQTFAMWGIILAVLFGFGLLAAIIFAMWRHQTAMMADVLRERGAGQAPPTVSAV